MHLLQGMAKRVKAPVLLSSKRAANFWLTDSSVFTIDATLVDPVEVAVHSSVGLIDMGHRRLIIGLDLVRCRPRFLLVLSDPIVQPGEGCLESGERLIELCQILRHFLIQALLTGLSSSFRCPSRRSATFRSSTSLLCFTAASTSRLRSSVVLFDRPGQLVETRIHLGVLRFETFLQPHITGIGIRLQLGGYLLEFFSLLLHLPGLLLKLR